MLWNEVDVLSEDEDDSESELEIEELEGAQVEVALTVAGAEGLACVDVGCNKIVLVDLPD